MSDNNQHAVILEKMDNLHGIVVRIEAQAIKTNGRVSSLERWKGYITGAIAVLMSLILPVLLLILSKVVENL